MKLNNTVAASLKSIPAIRSGLKVMLILLASALATVLLFLFMLALLSTSFENRNLPIKSVEIITVEQLKTPPKPEKIKPKNTSLLKAVEMPPAAKTKTVSVFKRQNITRQLAQPPIQFSHLPVSINLPSLSFAGRITGQGQSGTRESGRHLRGGSGSRGGLNQCTLVAHIGNSFDIIEQIEFIDCKNGALANDAEAEMIA